MITMMIGWPIIRRSISRSTSRPSRNSSPTDSGIAAQIGIPTDCVRIRQA